MYSGASPTPKTLHLFMIKKSEKQKVLVSKNLTTDGSQTSI
jgi:hypothetical protein